MPSKKSDPKYFIYLLPENVIVAPPLCGSLKLLFQNLWIVFYYRSQKNMLGGPKIFSVLQLPFFGDRRFVSIYIAPRVIFF